MLRWMRCLILPSGEFSHGISSAVITFGRLAYSLRNSSEFRISSARQLQVLLPDRACCLSAIALIALFLTLLLRDRWEASRGQAPDRAPAAIPPSSAAADA